MISRFWMQDLFAMEKLIAATSESYFATSWVTPSTEPLELSETSILRRGSMLVKLATMGDSITFLPGYYALHCPENLFFIVFKLCCLGLSKTCKDSPVLSLASHSLASSVSEIESCVGRVQSSLSGISNIALLSPTQGL